MELLDTLSEQEIKLTLKKFFAMTNSPIWVTDKHGEIVYSMSSDDSFDFDSLNTQVMSKKDDSSIYLQDSYQDILRKASLDHDSDDYNARDWLIGLATSDGRLIWAYPLTYFNQLLGFVLLTGVTFNEQNTQDADLVNKLSIYNQEQLKSVEVSNTKCLSLAVLTSWLDAFSLLGDELVDKIHHRKLAFVRRKIIEILKAAHKNIKVEPLIVKINDDGHDAQRGFERSQQWIANVYHQLCLNVKQLMAVNHFAILIIQNERNVVRVMGSSEKEKPEYTYSIKDNDSEEENVKSLKFFKQFKQTTEPQISQKESIIHPALPVEMINDIPLGEVDKENLRSQFDPRRGMWAPMMIQGRCVGVSRLLVDKTSLPLKPLHKQLFESFAIELNEHLETVISHYREAVIAAFPPLFAQLKFYQPAFFKENNPFAKVAEGVRLLLNCRGVVIRIRQPNDEKLNLVGSSNLFHEIMDAEDKDTLFEKLVLTSGVVQNKASLHYRNIYDYNAIINDMYSGDSDALSKITKTQEQDILDRIRIYEKYKFKSLKSIPVRDESDEIIGLINVFQGEHLAFTEHDDSGLNELAVHLGSFIQVRRLHERLSKRKQEETQLRQFYENLSVKFNRATNEQQLFKLVHDSCDNSKYIKSVDIWRCDYLYRFPFMERLFQAKTLKENTSKRSEYESAIKNIINFLQSIIINCKALRNEYIEAGVPEKPEEFNAEEQWETLSFWLHERLGKEPDQSIEDFLKILKKQLLDKDSHEPPNNIIFPGDHRYFDVKRVLHYGILSCTNEEKAAFNFHLFEEKPNNSLNTFKIKEDHIFDYMQQLKEANNQNNSPLLPSFSKAHLPKQHRDKNATWLPLIDESCDNIYGLVKFVNNRDEELVDNQSQEPRFYKNVNCFIARAVSSQLEKVWQSQTTDAQLTISDLFDIDKEPQQFFHEAAALIKQRLNAQAVIIQGCQSLKRDVLTAIGYAGFRPTHPLSDKYHNEFLDTELHKEFKTTTHYAYKERKSLLLSHMRYHHYCRIRYINALEKQFDIRNDKPSSVINYCAVPIIHAGEAIGLVELFNKTYNNAPHWFGQQDRIMLAALAEKLGQELSNYELIREADARVGTIVHGSRSPFHAIKGYTFNIQEFFEDIPDDVLEKYGYDEEIKQIPASINNTVDIANFFVETAMNEVRSKYEMAKEEPDEEINFNQLLDKLTDLFQFKLKFNQQNIIRDDASLEDLIFKGSKSRIMLLIANLLENAIKYGDKGSTITIKGLTRENIVTPNIRIEPQIGLSINNIGNRAYRDDEERQNLFRSFYRGKSLGEGKGAGMGLPLCKRIVEYYFGEINLDCIKTIDSKVTGENTSGFDTTAWFYLNLTGRELID